MLSGDGVEVRITQPSLSFHEAIVTHHIAEANANRAAHCGFVGRKSTDLTSSQETIDCPLVKMFRQT
jgi:hypothetical protein